MNSGYRHEYKYLISAADAKLLKLRLKHIMQPDPYTGPSGRYTIRSLYFDDLAHSAYYEKADGICLRSKYRIRIYNYTLKSIKLEKKEKLGNLTRKTAQTIQRSDAKALQRREVPETLENGDLLDELWLKIRSEGLRPMVLVDYDRTPFVCADGNTRITLDENLRTRPYCANLVASPAAMIPVLEKGQVILEVKFDDFLPSYLADALRDIPKANLAISKFALCMNLL
jgi:SPX domain protein involved in polyphosphate accumulation